MNIRHKLVLLHLQAIGEVAAEICKLASVPNDMSPGILATTGEKIESLIPKMQSDLSAFQRNLKDAVQ